VDIRVIEESPEENLSNIDALVESVEESLLEYYGSVDDKPLSNELVVQYLGIASCFLSFLLPHFTFVINS